MFTKTGAPQPMSVITVCCICGKNATVKQNGQLYCNECVPAINAINDSDIPSNICQCE